jgi:hypothetical protein
MSKATETKALTGPRLLTKEVPEYIGTFAEVTGFPTYKNWFTSASGNSIYHESYLDLSGYTNDYLTLMPSQVALQDPGYYTVQGAANAATAIFVIDVMSNERLDIDEVEADWLNFFNVPGMMTTTEDFEQIIFGQFRWMSPQTNFSFATALNTISAGTFGSGSPTTVAKLWCYRFVISNTGGFLPADRLAINAARFVMGATVVKEDELPFLMRQKRSYELATQG